jgi:perosamine synthetase
MNGTSRLAPHQLLEQRFGDWVGVDNVVACASGSAALHLALEALTLPLGSEVLVPEFTMVACARAVTLAGLRPVFVDCGEDLLIDPNKVEDKITGQTTAIMPVHIYGRQCDMAAIADIATINALCVIEDCAEAHGIKHGLADVSCWSFYKNKIIAGEEGGAVSFVGDRFADLARQLRCQGFTADHTFKHIPRGMNYRLSDCHAKLILESLEQAESNLAKRKQVADWYDRHLSPVLKMPKRDVNWVYDIRIHGLTGDRIHRVVKGLNTYGITARCGFKPMSSQPEYYDPNYYKTKAYTMSKEVLYLPINPRMDEPQVKRIVDTLEEVIRESS